MIGGSGVAIFPRPILGDPTTSRVTVCFLNACPICNLWYSCNNHLAAPCGHTYHPWCLREHTSNDSKCVVPFFEAIFTAEWCAAWGFRPEVTNTSAFNKGISNRLTTSPTSSMGVNKMNPIDPDSQWTGPTNQSKEDNEVSLEPIHVVPDDEENQAAPVGTQGSCDEVSNLTCEVCFVYPATITIQTTCPICDQPIESWKRNQEKQAFLQIHPLILSLGDAFDASLEPSACQKVRSQKGRKGKAIVPLDEEWNFDDETDSDTEASGLVRWCAKLSNETEKHAIKIDIPAPMISTLKL